MPKVGDREFEYSPEGLKQAQEYAAKTGEPVEKTQRYHIGGVVRPTRKKSSVRGAGKAKRGTEFFTT